MTDPCVERIEAWFDDPANEEGDFFRGDSAYWVCSPEAKSDRIIYLTKQHILTQIFENATGGLDTGFICRGGLPKNEDAAWLAAFVGNRKLIFVGDLDPAAVMLFAWLRAMLPAATLIHAGLNDELQKQLDYSMPTNCQIALNSPERKAVSKMDQFVPDARELLGSNAYLIWQNGFKFELEALLSHSVWVDAELLKLLTQM